MIADIIRELEKVRLCEVITSWKEVPIRVRLPLKWVSPQERLVSFDLRRCKFKRVFTDSVPVYIKVGEMFLLCKVFSNVKDELVLEVEAPFPAPPVVLREFIRVEPSEKEPVYVSFCVENVCSARAKAVDISESGVGVLLSKKEVGELLEVLSEIATNASKIHTPFDIRIELPREGIAKGQGELKNMLSREEDLYVRLGFKIDMEENQRKKIRQYVMRRQREILEQLKSMLIS